MAAVAPTAATEHTDASMPAAAEPIPLYPADGAEAVDASKPGASPAAAEGGDPEAPAPADAAAIDAALPPLDGPVGWRVVAASWCAHAVVLGLQYSVGVFLVPIADTFDESRGTVSWIGSISAALMLGMGAVTGKLIGRWGFRKTTFIGSLLLSVSLLISALADSIIHLFLSIGLGVGVAYSLCFLPAVSNVSQWFDKKRGMANGIAVSGSGIGQLILAPTAAALINAEGWRATFAFLGILAFVLLLVPSTQLRARKTAAMAAGARDVGAIIRSRNFRILAAANACGAIPYLVPFIHLAASGEDAGLSSGEAASLLLFVGVGSTVGRLAMGFAADFLGFLRMMVVTMTVMAGVMFGWPHAGTYAELVAVAAVFGFVAGGYISLQPTVLASLFGVDVLPQLNGVMFTYIACGVLVGPPLAGMAYDRTGDYKLAGLVGGILLLISSSLLLLIRQPGQQSQQTADVEKAENEGSEGGDVAA